MTGHNGRLAVRAMGAVLVTAALLVVSAPVPARAGDCAVPLGGTYTAFSDGQWAQTGHSYHDEVSVTSTWTVTSTCSDYLDCTGQVSSDQGWRAPAVCKSGLWTVTHDVPNWEPCPDGTAATGKQKFAFQSQTDATKFDGWDTTLGPSGACGVNQWLHVSMPFTLTKRE
jgi:hypothetical protein